MLHILQHSFKGRHRLAVVLLVAPYRYMPVVGSYIHTCVLRTPYSVKQHESAGHRQRVRIAIQLDWP